MGSWQRFSLQGDVLSHTARQARFRRAERNRVQVAEDHVPVPETESRSRHLARDHFDGLVVEILVVGRAPGVAHDDADAAPASGPTAALSVVVGPGRHVAHRHSVQPADVDPHLEGGRAGENVQRVLVVLETVLEFNPLGAWHLRCVLPALSGRRLAERIR